MPVDQGAADQANGVQPLPELPGLFLLALAALEFRFGCKFCSKMKGYS